MASQPNQRSVKIGEDERGGWSSDRPRRAGAPREADLSVRCRVLRPEAQMRYSPGSLMLIVSGSAAARDGLAARVLEGPGLVLSLDKVRSLLTARGAAEDVAAERAPELLDTAVLKRLEANETVVVTVEGVGVEERERFVRLAAKHRRPRHLIFVEAARDEVADEDRAGLNELRRKIDAGELGAEGFHSALRLGGQSVRELKRIVFRPEPRED
jgi:predicted transcriptional regulator